MNNIIGISLIFLSLCLSESESVPGNQSRNKPPIGKSVKPRRSITVKGIQPRKIAANENSLPTFVTSDGVVKHPVSSSQSTFSSQKSNYASPPLVRMQPMMQTSQRSHSETKTISMPGSGNKSNSQTSQRSGTGTGSQFSDTQGGSSSRKSGGSNTPATTADDEVFTNGSQRQGSGSHRSQGGIETASFKDMRKSQGGPSGNPSQFSGGSSGGGSSGGGSSGGGSSGGGSGAKSGNPTASQRVTNSQQHGSGNPSQFSGGSSGGGSSGGGSGAKSGNPTTSQRVTSSQQYVAGNQSQYSSGASNSVAGGGSPSVTSGSNSGSGRSSAGGQKPPGGGFPTKSSSAQSGMPSKILSRQGSQGSKDGSGSQVSTPMSGGSNRSSSSHSAQGVESPFMQSGSAGRPNGGVSSTMQHGSAVRRSTSSSRLIEATADGEMPESSHAGELRNKNKTAGQPSKFGTAAKEKWALMMKKMKVAVAKTKEYAKKLFEKCGSCKTLCASIKVKLAKLTQKKVKVEEENKPLVNAESGGGASNKPKFEAARKKVNEVVEWAKQLTNKIKLAANNAKCKVKESTKPLVSKIGVAMETVFGPKDTTVMNDQAAVEKMYVSQKYSSKTVLAKATVSALPIMDRWFGINKRALCKHILSHAMFTSQNTFFKAGSKPIYKRLSVEPSTVEQKDEFLQRFIQCETNKGDLVLAAPGCSQDSYFIGTIGPCHHMVTLHSHISHP